MTWPVSGAGAAAAAAGAGTVATAGAAICGAITGAAITGDGTHAAAGRTSPGSALTMRTLPSASVISSSEMFDADTRSTSVFSLRRSMHIPPGGVAAATNCKAGSCFYSSLSLSNHLRPMAAQGSGSHRSLAELVVRRSFSPHGIGQQRDGAGRDSSRFQCSSTPFDQNKGRDRATDGIDALAGAGLGCPTKQVVVARLAEVSLASLATSVEHHAERQCA